ncbi:Capsule polysaccharide export protein [Acidisarcina polymorpha]|uniref:Capsule polysaccharide export protein n=2 Tax=Acidisarcina polymorpha TaxID=2211140 RepID=A0A2Z5FTK4_9BACT|nr:Capsule polysaccharide export protein [Acidisarcina polymorpha]
MAQEGSAGFTVRADQKIVTADEIVRQFEAPLLTSYILGDGDEISVDVWNHPELSGKHVIGPDGKITVPIAGIVKVSELSREDAQAAIANSLIHYYSDLSITLRVDRYTSYRIYILGRAGVPGIVQFDSQPTLLDVVTRASAITSGGVGPDSAGLGRCAILRGRDQVIWVDLKSLLSQGSLALNIRLARNDMVYLPDAGEREVYVLGEVKHPGAFRLTPTMSFLDAFSQAGGATEDASENKIEIVRSASGTQREFRMSDLLSGPEHLNFALEEGDIIYVPRRNLAKFGYVLQKTSSLAAFAVLGTLGAK